MGGWRVPLLGAAINVGADMLTLHSYSAASGHAVSPGVLLAGHGLPLLPGKAAFYLPGGVVVVILAYRVVSSWLPTVAGHPYAA